MGIKVRYKCSIVLLIMSILTGYFNFNVCAANTREHLGIKIEPLNYYLVPNDVYNIFLNNINAIDYLIDNSEFATVFYGDSLILDKTNIGTLIDKEDIKTLSNKEKLLDIFKEYGIRDVHDYVFFTTPNMPVYLYMPLFVWIKTSNGIEVASISRGLPEQKDSILKFCTIDILNAEDFIKRYSAMPAKVFVNDKEIEFNYAKVQNKGAEFSLKELIESIDGKYYWDKEIKIADIKMPAENLKLKSGMRDIELKISLTDFDGEYYSIWLDFCDPNIRQEKHIEVNKFCKLYKDDIVISQIGAKFVLAYLSGNSNSYVDINADNKEIKINFDYNIKSAITYMCINDEMFYLFFNNVFADNDNVFMPLRDFITRLGAEVSWDDNTNTVTAQLSDKEIVFSIDSGIMFVNNVSMRMSAPTRLTDNRTYVPIKDLKTALGYQIEWDENLNRVDVLTSK